MLDVPASPSPRVTPPNPYLRLAARTAALRHAQGAIVVSDGAADSVWAFAPMRLAPGLTLHRSLIAPRYDACGGPMVAQGATEDLLARMLAEPALAGGSGVLLAANIVAEGPAWDALLAMAAEGRIAIDPMILWQRSLLERSAAPDADAYLQQAMSRSRLKRMRQKKAAIERAGPLTLQIGRTPREVEASFDAFCTLEAAGWKGRAGTALAQDAPGRAYVRDVMTAAAADGEAFTMLLMQGDRIIAAALLLRAGGEVLFWKTAYDEALARHSPGVVLDMMVTEWLYAQPWFERMDTGHDDSVDPGRELWAERRPMATVAIMLKPASLRGRLVVWLLKLRQALRAWRNRRQAAK